MLKKRYSTSRSNTALTAGDDVDDETFLNTTRNSRSAVSPYGQSSGNSIEAASKALSFANLDEQRTQLINSRKDLENKTLESTKRSLNLLNDSEQVGIATAEVSLLIIRA